jgi:hypothetical protein
MKTAKVFPPLLAALALFSAVGLLACEDDVGIPCQMSGIAAAEEGTTTGAQINQQAMDCVSRLCLYYGGLAESRALCTKICEDDGDCPDATDTCSQGFTCIPATETTKLACCKMCVCRNFVVEAENSSLGQYCESHPNDSCPDL